MDEYWRDPILDEESQVLGNPSAPTLTRGSGFTSESLRAHKDNDSFDENAEYQESVTRGDENYQAELLREIELENETQYFDADGNTVPTYLEDHMDQETDEAQKEAQEQGLRHEYQVRAEQLKKKQDAIEEELKIIESERARKMANAKRIDKFHKEQTMLRRSLAHQQETLRERRKKLEELRREVTEDKSDKKGKPDKGKEPEFPRRKHFDDYKDGYDDGNGDDDGGNDPDDNNNPDDEPEDDDSSIRSGRSHTRYRMPSPIRHNTHSNLKYPPPQKFDGTPRTPVGNWLFNVDTYFDAVGASDEQRTPYAALLLMGNAQTWWRLLKEKGTQPRRWNQFKAIIEEQFHTINDEKKARNTLRNLRQTTSVTNYIAAFTELTLRIKDMGDADIYYNFMDGLKREIKEEMEKRDLPQNLKVLQSHASTYDDLLFQQRNSSRPEHGRFPPGRNFN